MLRALSSQIALKAAWEIAFSPSEDRIGYFGGRDVTVLDLRNGTPIFSVHPIANPSHIDFSPDGQCVYVVRHFFGTAASLFAVAALFFGWWLLHLSTQRRLDGLYAQFQQLDNSQRAQALSELDPEIRKDIEKRIAKERPANQVAPVDAPAASKHQPRVLQPVFFGLDSQLSALNPELSLLDT